MESPGPLLGPRRVAVGGRTLLMGVIDVTPDSCCAASRAAGPAEAAALAVRLESEGADVLDVGGCSTRPGAAAVSPEVEMARVVPAVRAIRSAVGCALSVDTWRGSVARSAVRAGADLISDGRGLAGDPEMPSAVAELDVPVIAVAAGPLPRAGDPVEAVAAQLRDILGRAARAGIEPGRVILDPGFGCGKTGAQSLTLVGRLGELRALGRPLCLGLSRGGAAGGVLGGAGPEGCPEGHAALVALAVAAGVAVVRVHDVGAMAAVAHVAQAVAAAGGPEGSVRGRPPLRDRIRVEGLRFEATHGVYPEEHLAPQPFLVDVELVLDLEAAGRSDDLAQTVDYNQVARMVAEVVEGPSRHLIEALAEAVADRVRSAFPVTEVRVRVHKPRAPVGLPFADISVEVVRRR